MASMSPLMPRSTAEPELVMITRPRRSPIEAILEFEPLAHRHRALDVHVVFSGRVVEEGIGMLAVVLGQEVGRAQRIRNADRIIKKGAIALAQASRSVSSNRSTVEGGSGGSASAETIPRHFVPLDLDVLDRGVAGAVKLVVTRTDYRSAPCPWWSGGAGGSCAPDRRRQCRLRRAPPRRFSRRRPADRPETGNASVVRGQPRRGACRAGAARRSPSRRPDRNRSRAGARPRRGRRWRCGESGRTRRGWLACEHDSPVL